jgi:hypothetical protein
LKNSRKCKESTRAGDHKPEHGPDPGPRDSTKSEREQEAGNILTGVWKLYVFVINHKHSFTDGTFTGDSGPP